MIYSRASWCTLLTSRAPYIFQPDFAILIVRESFMVFLVLFEDVAGARKGHGSV